MTLLSTDISSMLYTKVNTTRYKLPQQSLPLLRVLLIWNKGLRVNRYLTMLTLLIRLKHLSVSRDLTMLLLLLILLLSILLLLVLLLRTFLNNILRETRLILTLEVLLVLLVLIMLVLAVRKLLSTAISVNKAKPRPLSIPAGIMHLLLGPGLLLLRAGRRCTVPVVVRVNRVAVPTGLLASVPDEEEAT